MGSTGTRLYRVARVARYDGNDWYYYTTAEGLSGNDIRAIVEGDDGDIWFATENGVSRYDGSDWRVYRTTGEPPWDYDISCIAEDKEGNLWFGSVGGALRLSGEDWRLFTTEDGLSYDLVNAMVVAPDGAVWFSTRKGVSRFDRDTWQAFTGLGAQDSMLDIAISPDGRILVGSIDGLMVYDGANWEQILLTPNDGSSDFIRKIVVGQDGLFWLTMDFKIYAYDLNSREITYVSEVLPTVTDMQLDRDGKLWVSTVHGVKYYDGQAWHDFAMANVETDVDVTTMFIDKDGVKWFAILRKGLIRFDGNTWQTFTTANGLSNNDVGAIYQDSYGNIWFGTGSGISRYSP